MTPGKIRLIRKKTRLSQSVFAAVLNTSVSTVQKWKIGEEKPSGPSLKLLDLIERKALEVVLYDNLSKLKIGRTTLSKNPKEPRRGSCRSPESGRRRWGMGKKNLFDKNDRYEPVVQYFQE